LPLLVGSLCAIGLFNLCCRGYDWKDEAAGTFTATTPAACASAHQRLVGDFHLVFAISLFLTLAFFCLVLFKMTAANVVLTRKKIQRNRVYTVCGWAILASIVMVPLLGALGVKQLGPFGVMFCFETTAFFAFGVAWLVKGETILKD
jgi:hypothetical protein